MSARIRHFLFFLTRTTVYMRILLRTYGVITPTSFLLSILLHPLLPPLVTPPPCLNPHTAIIYDPNIGVSGVRLVLVVNSTHAQYSLLRVGSHPSRYFWVHTIIIISIQLHYCVLSLSFTY